jgi:hypothetical protein
MIAGAGGIESYKWRSMAELCDASLNQTGMGYLFRSRVIT